MPSKGPQDFDFEDDDEDPKAPAKEDEVWTESSPMAVKITAVPPGGLPPQVPYVLPGATSSNPDADGPEKDAAIAAFMAEALTPNAHSDRRMFDARWTPPDLRQAYRDALDRAKTDAEENIRVALSVMDGGEWPTLDDCIPKDSLLDEIDKAFVDTTDIPRELPMFAAIHYVSALLLQRGGCPASIRMRRARQSR